MKNRRVRHIPNIITSARVPLTLLQLCFILRGETVSAMLVFAAICFTDILDGAVARALGACTRLGATMDVAADVLYVMASLAVLNICGLAPVWFTLVVAFKFIEFAVTSKLMKRSAGKANVWIFDGCGRCFAALAFASPGVFCLVALMPAFSAYIAILFIPACIFAITSFAARAIRCYHAMRSGRVTAA
jgi:CDP-diacylglycerol--glycerol-3-phosphate 3-phosphatidyltransferase